MSAEDHQYGCSLVRDLGKVVHHIHPGNVVLLLIFVRNVPPRPRHDEEHGPWVPIQCPRPSDRRSSLGLLPQVPTALQRQWWVHDLEAGAGASWIRWVPCSAVRWVPCSAEFPIVERILVVRGAGIWVWWWVQLAKDPVLASCPTTGMVMMVVGTGYVVGLLLLSVWMRGTGAVASS